jgi:hypothetical protein
MDPKRTRRPADFINPQKEDDPDQGQALSIELKKGSMSSTNISIGHLANLRAMKDKKSTKSSESKPERINWGSKARVIVRRDNGFDGDDIGAKSEKSTNSSQ